MYMFTYCTNTVRCDHFNSNIFCLQVLNTFSDVWSVSWSVTGETY